RALVLHMLVLALHLHQRLRSILAALLLPSKRTLQPPQFLLSVPVELRVFDFLAIRSGDERGYSHIHAHPAPRFGQRRFVRHVTDKTGIPSSGFVYNAYRLNRTFDGSVPAHTDAANAEHLQAPAIQSRAHAELRAVEAVKAVASLEAWITGLLAFSNPPKEAVKGFTQINRHRLQGLRKHDFRLGKCPAIQSCLLDLLVFADAAT